MKTKLFALSLSFTLVACSPQHALLAPTSHTAQGQSQNVHISYRTAQTFSTQAVDLNALKFIRLSAVGGGINGTLSGELVPVTAGTVQATLQNVPLQPGELRVVTVQGYDAEKQPLSAFVGKGYYVSQSGVANVSIQIDRRRLLVGRILESLLQSNPAIAKNFDIATLQTLVDTATDFNSTTGSFGRDPLEFDIEPLVSKIQAGTPLTDQDFDIRKIRRGVLLTLRTPTPGKVLDEALTLTVNDPFSDPVTIAKGTSDGASVELGRIAPGNYSIRITQANGTVVGNGSISVDVDGRLASPLPELKLQNVSETLSPIIYVNTAAMGTENGSSFANAYTSLKTALNAASSGQQIWVAEGTYAIKETLTLKNGVQIIGGFDRDNPESAPENRDPDNVTVITGKGDFELQGTFGGGIAPLVQTSGGSVTLDGLTFSEADSEHVNGGAIWVQPNHQLTLKNVVLSDNKAQQGAGLFNEGTVSLSGCTLKNNTAQNSGGGIYNSGTLNISKSTLEGNQSGNNGGGIHNEKELSLNEVEFKQNVALAGGGLRNGNSGVVTGSNVNFEANIGGYIGGGVSNFADLTLSNVSFTSNKANDGEGNGAGFYNGGSAGTASLNNAIFANNEAHNSGGGVYQAYDAQSFSAINIVFVNNIAGIVGGGFYGGPSGTLIQANFINNSAIMGGGGVANASNLSIKNTVFWKSSLLMSWWA